MREFTSNAKAALMLAEKYAKRMHQGYVGCEHILLGLVEEGAGTASIVLQENGVDAAKIREMIRDLIAFDSSIILEDKEKYLGTIQLFFLITNMYTLFFRIINGIYTLDLVPYTVLGIVGIMIGKKVGVKIVNHIDAATMKKLVYAFLGFAGLTNVI